MIYISGKISGDPNYKAKFKAMEQKLKEKFPGEPIFNPADISLPECCSWEDYMDICIRFLTRSTTICMLNDWPQSKGAYVEFQFAKVRDMTFLYEIDLQGE